MRIPQKLNSIMVLVFSIGTILCAALAFFEFINIDIVMLLLGLTQLFSGISQVNLSQQINSKGLKRGNKMVGIFSIILGLVIISMFIIKINLF